MAESPYILEMTGIDKVFPGVHALDQCHFNLRQGEVHALIGKNGAGKSTLAKIMSGICCDYAGEYKLFEKVSRTTHTVRGVVFEQELERKLFGQSARFHSIRDAQRAGIFIVHQEINLVKNLTVAQNIFIGRESDSFFCDDNIINRKTALLFRDFDVGVRPVDRVGDLTTGKCRMVELARAVSYSTLKVLILDEPTAALSEKETEELFEKIEKLKARGVAVVFSTHRLQEISRIADRVTVLRDGKCIDTLDAKECSTQKLIQLMTGQNVTEVPKMQSAVSAGSPVILEALHLQSGRVKDVSFTLRRGEILGFTGLIGAGCTETMRLICGADRMTSGEIRVHGKLLSARHPADAIAAGIGYLPEDRKRYGLLPGLSVTDNTVLPSYGFPQFHNGMFVNEKQCEETSAQYVEQMETRTPSVKEQVQNLSGGNQQKVIISKWLLRDCDILIFDEPARGIDVSARAEIYRLMNGFVKKGKSIIMISDDIAEIMQMSDRIIVMCEGRKTGELDIADATQEKIIALASRPANDYAVETDNAVETGNAVESA